MSVVSIFVFNKLAKHLKDKNILMRKFLYLNFSKKEIIIDDVKFDFTAEIAKEIEKQYSMINDISEILITPTKVVIRTNNEPDKKIF